MEYFCVKDSPKLKTSKIIAKLREKFNVYVYDEENIDKNFPAPEEETTRYFKKVVEADEENSNKSADDLNQEEQITLRERLIMELQYFEETGNHLDIENITLCAGSRYADGVVPDVGWGSGARKLYVHWYDPGYRDAGIRARSVVSNPLSSPTSPLSEKETVLQTFTRFISKSPRTQEYDVLESEDVLVIKRK